MQFSELIGSDVLVLIPRIGQVNYQRVKVIGVEPGGIWIESQEFVNAMLHAIKAPVAPKTPVFFVPFHEIATAIASIPGPALDEKAFGV